MLTPDGRLVVKSDAALTGIIKALLILLMVYEGWYLEKYTAISGVLQVLAGAVVAATALLLVKNRRRSNNPVIKGWVAFGLYGILAGMAVQPEMDVVLSSVVTYFAFIAVIYCAGVVSECTSDYAWFSRSILLVSLLSAFFALFYGVPYQNGSYYVTTMSEFNNPNNLGFLMSIGSFVVIFPERKPKLWGWMSRLVILFAFLTVTVNTGSRSALLCEISIIVFFVVRILGSVSGDAAARVIKKTAIILVALLAVILAFRIASDHNTAGSAIRRLAERFKADAFSGRTDLYEIAWDMYKEHPILGIGYNCFATESMYGYYTHSTYMELLACTGTIGFFLFLTPVFSATVRGIRNNKADDRRSAAILVMMLISGFFSVIYYSMIFLMMLYMEILRMPENAEEMQAA